MSKNKLSVFIIVGALIIAGFLLLIAGSNNSPADVRGLPGSLIINHSTVNFGLAPDFSLATLDGATLNLSSYRGVKPVILDFFATWCPNCRRDIPHEAELYQKYKDKVEVIGVNLRENPATVSDFARDFGIPFAVVLDPNGLASNLYGINYTNVHILIDKDGKLVRNIPGDVQESDFLSLIGA